LRAFTHQDEGVYEHSLTAVVEVEFLIIGHTRGRGLILYYED